MSAHTSAQPVGVSVPCNEERKTLGQRPYQHLGCIRA